MADEKDWVLCVDNVENLEQVMYRTSQRDDGKRLLGSQINPYSLAAFWVGCSPFQVQKLSGVTLIRVEKPKKKTYKAYSLSLQVGNTPVCMKLKVADPTGTKQKEISCPFQTQYTLQILYDEEKITVDVWKNDFTQSINDLEIYLREQEEKAKQEQERQKAQKALEKAKEGLAQAQARHREGLTANDRTHARILEKAEHLADRILKQSESARLYDEKIRALAETRQCLASRQAARRDAETRADRKEQALQAAVRKREGILQQWKKLTEEQEHLRQAEQELRQKKEEGRQAEEAALLAQLAERSGKNLPRLLLLRWADVQSIDEQPMDQEIRHLSKQQEELEEKLYDLRRQVEQAVDSRTNELNQKK